MIIFFQGPVDTIYALNFQASPTQNQIEKLSWLFNGELINSQSLDGNFIGPRREMVTPWSTNAVEIVQNMGVPGVIRIEQFRSHNVEIKIDPMLEREYEILDQNLFTIDHTPEQVMNVDNIADYSQQEGLALSDEEIKYLENVSDDLGRKLTDSEVFGFSQVNSEHCRHKIFNGKFIIDGEEKSESLFEMIKRTSSRNPNGIVSAYSDNVAFVEGPVIEQFAPHSQDKADVFETTEIESILSLKAETHNFPTTVEPFNGAATGSGGEIRDRMAGGKASIPLAGTAVYMTSYPRLNGGRSWETLEPRPWLYQTPLDILIKASNGASDFGNKFGQPLIAGSVLTFEHELNGKSFGYDKVVMLAGGIGFGKKQDSQKGKPEPGDKVVVLGGDNYRIGMGGGSVSSVATGEYGNEIELNAIQRSNPEMQKRVYNAIRAMAESRPNAIVSIHDHGAGGHLNCLSELLEASGGVIHLEKLPVGDPTLSAKEIIGNESQERMGLVVREEDLPSLKEIAERERAPLYVVGEVTGDQNFKFTTNNGSQNPVNLKLSHLFGSSPKTILEDITSTTQFQKLEYHTDRIDEYLENVLQLEAVACKDWLTNKVDRSVTGKVARQQCTGTIQLPLNDVGVMALDYRGSKGVATSIGHAPISALIDPVAGSVLSVAEALTNIIWAPLKNDINGISLSANWMWPARNPGEDTRLYQAVEAISKFVIELGLNIPTGKDSLSMTQKYKDGQVVYSPGTVVVSAVAEVTDIKKVVSPTLMDKTDSELFYINFSSDSFHLGGSSFAQIVSGIGEKCPTIRNPEYFRKAFNLVQQLIKQGYVLSGHDISSGGLITALLEMTFPCQDLGMSIDLGEINEEDIAKILFNENPGVIVQLEHGVDLSEFSINEVDILPIGRVNREGHLGIKVGNWYSSFDIARLRDRWFRTSYLLDKHQTRPDLAESRFKNYSNQPLKFVFPKGFNGRLSGYGLSKDRKKTSGVKAAIIREKGVNGDREMAYSLYLAGFDVKDIHMTDLVSGREDLEDVSLIVFVGGFSNSDVLGSAKGWAGVFLFNNMAKKALDSFYSRSDTLSLGVCNGCQLMMELGLLYPERKDHPRMHDNASGKFESSFLNVSILENNSVMFRSLSGSQLGIWVAHGEGRFSFADDISEYNLIGTYSYSDYPGNPNGSEHNAAILSSMDGRHTVLMPHLERSIMPWQWAWYPQDRPDDEVTPWIKAFVKARHWIEERQ